MIGTRCPHEKPSAFALGYPGLQGPAFDVMYIDRPSIIVLGLR